MNSTIITPQSAQSLDAQDPLAHFREKFVITDPNTIYLDGNSLGRLPRRTGRLLRDAVETQWGARLIRGWNEGWIDLPLRLGTKIAPLIGAQLNEVLVTEATSSNLFKLAVAALRARSGRHTIVTDVFNFPSDVYILQGICDMLGGQHRITLVPSPDDIHVAPEAIADAITEDTALVTLSHVAFKSAFMHDMAQVTKLAHDAGALVLWDLSHSVGAVPVDLNGCGADLAVGCTYKYLNGGPGAPAFLYVREDLQTDLTPPVWGWLGSQSPFAFDLDYAPAEGIARFQVGTPSILSMLAIEPGLDVMLEAGIDAVRAKSIQQTGYLITLAEQWLLPLGFSVGTPLAAEQRGSHISLRHPEGYRINRALIDATPPTVRIIPDFREPDNIRLGVAPLYTTFSDIYRALKRMREIVESNEYARYSTERALVT